ncbi:MAG: hypothetical protein QOI38_2743, partial [Sphingomonadales bacterium]|nr:hypothetical protein [Sphingomonadales bacterium]
HLPHEAWHVVQQKQGKVKPTLHLGSRPVNDEPVLESEADHMGARATAFVGPAASLRAPSTGSSLIQRVLKVGSEVYDVPLFSHNRMGRVREILTMIKSALKAHSLELSVKGHQLISDLCKEPKTTEFENLPALVKWTADQNLTYQKMNINAPGPKTLGKRPAFKGEPNQLAYGKDFGGGARRHVISSSTLGEAIEASPAKDEEVKAFLDRHNAGVGNASQLAARVAAWHLVHNHVGNLWVGPAPINTAIGFVRGPLQQVIDLLKSGPMKAVDIAARIKPPQGPMNKEAQDEWAYFVTVASAVLIEEMDDDGYVEADETINFLTDVVRNADLDIPDVAGQDYREKLTQIYLSLKNSKQINIFQINGALDQFMALRTDVAPAKQPPKPKPKPRPKRKVGKKKAAILDRDLRPVKFSMKQHARQKAWLADTIARISADPSAKKS